MQIEYIEQKLLELCKEAIAQDRIPVSAVVTKNDEIVSWAFNGIKSIEHAEIIALEKAMNVLNAKRLDGCNIYVSLEPCPMCTYAISLARIEKVYFFSLDDKKGAILSNANIIDHFELKLKWEYKKNSDFENMLKGYFKNKRRLTVLK
ncbi:MULTISPECIES: nucleoside deaminase [unclassified Hydrogenobaculum]|uniref:nucleoside deaminase n=1 Tax=unclassified Hydrogenobaculum TaxID=2622382 RepID=UPI0001C52523|nr:MULTISPECIES: nucleoside deaminase [unclassified Hydrogenobaculum]AEF19375.1 CMP/dCMP deaminase zinc-binding protein [Hydrogenobaculum sp. 3684]AEG46664.1 CMP/dCMP deaminase zinc-binding protein [Hydrogenobaculum sp. SHO]AGG15308.1 CMP/dCMP deaminase zinc-binding protein [Hydrogenobaculum sp. HO]AGH93610.1 cytosine/adenosine deaminase [Hydrogenobaculum sp. SN]